MSIKKVFVDTDIILDLFLKREPNLENARKVFQLGFSNKIKLFSSVTTFTNAYYILTKVTSNAKAKEKLAFLEKRLTTLETKHKNISQALTSRFSDFEDAVQHYTAMEHKMDIIITRNIKDYKYSILPVKTTTEFLDWII